MAASITVHLQIFKRPQLLCFSTDLDETDIKRHGLLRWVFILFGAVLANSNLYKKTIFKEISTKALYQFEECLFCNTSKLLFNRNIISIL